MDLAQKYRSKKFSSIRGNDATINLLINRIRKNKLSDFTVLYGVPGTSKTVLGYLLVKASRCEHLLENGDPCGTCASCKMIDESLFKTDQAA